jgi:hypothetical protein
METCSAPTPGSRKSPINYVRSDAGFPSPGRAVRLPAVLLDASEQAEFGHVDIALLIERNALGGVRNAGLPFRRFRPVAANLVCRGIRADRGGDRAAFVEQHDPPA